MVLVAAVLWVDNGYSAITDEGAVVAQTDALADGERGVELPLPTVDPDGDAVTMENSAVAGGTYLPYPKHPLYPYLLVVPWSLLDHGGVLLVSALGAWCAALGGAGLARRISPDLELPAMWFLGVGTPLVFDATVVMAHGLAAAVVAGMVLAALRFLDGDGARFCVLAAALALPLTMFRTEGLLASLALGGAVSLMAVSTWRPFRIRWRTAVGGSAIAATGMVSYVLDARWADRFAGPDAVLPVGKLGPYDLVAGRAQALWVSVLRPAEGTPDAVAFLVLLGTVVLIGAALLLRIRPGRAPLVGWLVVGAAALSVLRLISGPGLITGLVPAAPVVVAGLVLLRRGDLSSSTARLCATNRRCHCAGRLDHQLLDRWRHGVGADASTTWSCRC